MNAFKWTLFGLYLFNMLATVYMIDKPRDRITPGHAVVSLLVTGGMGALVYYA